MKKIVALGTMLLMVVAAGVGQKVTCVKLEHQGGTLCEKVVQGRHSYTLEEVTATSVSLRPVTAAKANQLIETEGELMTVHAISDMKIKEYELEHELKTTAIRVCQSAADPDKCYETKKKEIEDMIATDIATYEAQILATAPTKKSAAKK